MGRDTNYYTRPMLAEIERLQRALAFACSVIKSGEPWTETCEKELKL
jgi:hypothetical protein